jgi:hypothetical protein
MRRRPVPPTHHLKTAIRKIDKIVWKLHDEQLAAYIAYVLVVSQGEKREIRKLFGTKFTAFGDLSAELERKLTPKERRRAVRFAAYEAEMAALHDAAKRLQARMEASYTQQGRFKNGILDESEERHPKAPPACVHAASFVRMTPRSCVLRMRIESAVCSSSGPRSIQPVPKLRRMLNVAVRKKPHVQVPSSRLQ